MEKTIGRITYLKPLAGLISGNYFLTLLICYQILYAWKPSVLSVAKRF